MICKSICQIYVIDFTCISIILIITVIFCHDFYILESVELGQSWGIVYMGSNFSNALYSRVMESGNILTHISGKRNVNTFFNQFIDILFN